MTSPRTTQMKPSINRGQRTDCVGLRQYVTERQLNEKKHKFLFCLAAAEYPNRRVYATYGSPKRSGTVDFH